MYSYQSEINAYPVLTLFKDIVTAVSISCLVWQLGTYKLLGQV